MHRAACAMRACAFTIDAANFVSVQRVLLSCLLQRRLPSIPDARKRKGNHQQKYRGETCLQVSPGPSAWRPDEMQKQ
eukprot:3347953-Amphidinium_carterae.1